MNALAAARTGWDLGTATLWSSPEDWLRPHWVRLTELSAARELRTPR